MHLVQVFIIGKSGRQTRCGKSGRQTKGMSQSLAEIKSAEDKHTLDVAKKEVYTAGMRAQEAKLQEFTADLQSESGWKNCFRNARQMAREGRDVISVCCMKNDAGNIVSDADGMKNIWRKYMENLLNVENG